MISENSRGSSFVFGTSLYSQILWDRDCEQSVTPVSPRYGKGPLGLADIRSATRLPPQPPGPPGVPLSDMGVMKLIF